MEKPIFTGRRITKGFSLPLDLVEFIEARAKERDTDQSKAVVDLLERGLKAERAEQGQG